MTDEAKTAGRKAMHLIWDAVDALDAISCKIGKQKDTDEGLAKTYALYRELALKLIDVLEDLYNATEYGWTIQEDGFHYV